MSKHDSPDASVSKRPGLVLNVDINSVVTPFLNETARNLAVHAEDLYPFIDQYANTHITDVVLNVFCQFSNTPSRIFTTGVEKYRQTVENGIPVDYTERYEGLHHITTVSNLDIYEIWFRRCREQGMRAWLSVRMNDAHCPDDDTSFLRSDFFYLARRNNWMIGPQYGYYRHCFDYAVPEVRQIMLAYLAEQLDRYDVDGLELDWLREIYCFDYRNNRDKAAIMNDFMRSVKMCVRRAERKWGHPILIMCRLMRDVSQNLAFGFDAATWVAEGLVDVIAVSPRWATCDSAMPLEQWLPLCRKVALYAGLEILVGRQDARSMATAEVARGYAAQYVAAGADKIYLYNYFQNPHQPIAELADIYQSCGLPETITTLPRRHVVTWQDLCPDGFTPYQPLPVTLQPGETACIAVGTGPVQAESLTQVIVGIQSAAAGTAPPKILLNGLPCGDPVQTTIASFDGTTGSISSSGYVSEQDRLFAYRFTSRSRDNSQQVTVQNGTDCALTLTYLEIAVN